MGPVFGLPILFLPCFAMHLKSNLIPVQVNSPSKSMVRIGVKSQWGDVLFLKAAHIHAC